jgi:hypothetical protein
VEVFTCGMISGDMVSVQGLGPALPAGDADLRTGQRVVARVLEMLQSGEALLEFGQHRSVVAAGGSLQAGDRVTLEVLTGGAKPEVRVVTDSPSTTPPLVTGQHLEAQVLEMLHGGEVQLAFGQSRAVVPTSQPLVAGDHVMLEVVAGGVKPELRILPGSTGAPQPPVAAHAVGQRVEARVLEMLPDGEVALVFGQSRTVVPTSTPLEPGDHVVLEVVAAAVTGGVDGKFRIVTDEEPAVQPQPGTPQRDDTGKAQGLPPLSARDLPVLLGALAHAAPAAVPKAVVLQEFLRAAPVLPGHPAIMNQIQRLLAPLDAALPPEALAVNIRSFLEQSGLFTENHLRGALKNSTVAAAADQQQPVADLRVLLGQLTTAGTPVPDAVRDLGDALLQQQLVTAGGLAGTGVGHIQIPFTFGQERVDVVFEWERKAPREKQDQPDHDVSLGVFVTLPALGAIEARVDWKRDALGVTFYVERDATRAIIEAGLSDFAEELSQSGCPAVTANVWLNPARLATSVSPVTAPVAGGTILDVMA